MKQILCFFGWHEFSCTVQDYVDEFGYVPLDGRIPKNAKCTRCNISPKTETK